MKHTLLYWNINPVIIERGPFKIGWYGLLLAGVFLIGYGIIWGIYKREGLDPSSLLDLLFYLLVAAVVGARLGHCLIYNPSYYL